MTQQRGVHDPRGYPPKVTVGQLAPRLEKFDKLGELEELERWTADLVARPFDDTEVVVADRRCASLRQH